jgi:hypothetical protein
VRVDLPCVEKNRGFALYNVLSPSGKRRLL